MRLARVVQVLVMGLRRLCGLSPLIVTWRSGVHWELDLREGIDFSIWLLGSFEPRTVRCYRNLIRPGDTVLDIGANIGAHTLLLADAVGPTGRVIAFEPTEFALGKLQRNLALNPGLAARTQCLQCMLVDEAATGAPAPKVYSSWPLQDAAGLHHLHQGRLMPAAGASLLTLDAAVARLGLERVDYIKLDIDGSECAMLRGANGVLTRWRPTIIMELAPYMLEERGGTLHELVTLLARCGYELSDPSTGRPYALDAAKLQAMIAPGSSLNVVARPGAGATPARTPGGAVRPRAAFALVGACLLLLALYVAMIDLKGIDTDEGIRLGIVNGGQQYLQSDSATRATWAQVLAANETNAYQPVYFLVLNAAMRLAGTNSVILLRLVNIGFLELALGGLLALTAGWRLRPRLFLLIAFGANSYLFMHVLQIREYILGVVFYIWSTWLVLRLDQRRFGRGWLDLGWFGAYGLLLTLGFYSQTWVVFPAIGQGLFLVFRRAGNRGRFYAHLAFSYLIVYVLTVPYLQLHPGKVDVGRWGHEIPDLPARIADGFHLVLTGQHRGASAFVDFLFWFWLAVIAAAGLLRPGGRVDPAAPSRAEDWRQVRLIMLSMAVPLGFQIIYFYRVDTLSLWPRYFIIHYFFLLWLLALAFRYFDELGRSPGVAAGVRLAGRVTAGLTLAMLLASSAGQVYAYCRSPYDDTGMTADSNWRTLAADLAQVERPGDVVLVHDFLHAVALTYTRPLREPLVPLKGLGPAAVASAARVIYPEAAVVRAGRGALAAQLARLGFPVMAEAAAYAPDGRTPLPDWEFLVFTRR